MELPDTSKEESDKSTVLPTKCGICGDPHFYRDCKYVIINTKVIYYNLIILQLISTIKTVSTIKYIFL